MNLRSDTTASAAVPATRSTRTSIEDAIERLLAVLDHLDGDADFEEQHDAEPEESDCDVAGARSDLEHADGDYDGPGYIWGGQGA